jgi:hypothetical protein
LFGLGRGTRTWIVATVRRAPIGWWRAAFALGPRIVINARSTRFVVFAGRALRRFVTRRPPTLILLRTTLARASWTRAFGAFFRRLAV